MLHERAREQLAVRLDGLRAIGGGAGARRRRRRRLSSLSFSSRRRRSAVFFPMPVMTVSLPRSFAAIGARELVAREAR